MDLNHARRIIAAYSKERFGSFLELGDVSVVRRASGRGWRGDLYCNLKSGPILTCSVYLSEEGRILDECTNDSVVDTLVQAHIVRERSVAKRSAKRPSNHPNDFAGILEAEAVPGSFAFPESDTSVRGTIDTLRNTGDRENLLRARELLPRLLSRPTGRGFVLLELGEVELALEENALALNYLEAAAREFADVADIGALELVAEMVLSIEGPDAFACSRVKNLLDKSRTRLKPLERLDQAAIFAGLGHKELEEIGAISQTVIAKHGQLVMKEGNPATIACVVRSGILSIRIEDPTGNQRIIRCCYPGDFLGETSVIGARDATCSATVQTDCLTSLWLFNGNELRHLCRSYPAIHRRIESARTWNRLDSFFSVQESTQALDVSVRDKLLACIVGMKRLKKGDVLLEAGRVPSAAYLLAEGRAEGVAPDGSVRCFASDSFIGLRDVLHELTTEVAIAVSEPSLLIAFDSERLRTMAADATPEVVAAMERMG